jgi:hypothetical protein
MSPFGLKSQNKKKIMIAELERMGGEGAKLAIENIKNSMGQ